MTNNTGRVREIVNFNRTEWKVKEPIALKVCGAHFQGFYRATPCRPSCLTGTVFEMVMADLLENKPATISRDETWENLLAEI